MRASAKRFHWLKPHAVLDKGRRSHLRGVIDQGGKKRLVGKAPTLGIGGQAGHQQRQRLARARSPFICSNSR